jgi:2-methylcitrate dehydratase
LTLSGKLAEYAVSLRWSDLDRRTVECAKHRILDALGCAVGSYDERPVRIARKVASRVTASKAASILGTRSKTAPDWAAFVNSLMIRYFDFNDTYLSKEPAHPSDNIGACLATAEALGRGGEELILATVLAYEVQCRLCDAADLRHRGWDHVNYGLVSTALASSKLLGLGTAETEQAVNISLNSHIAMRQVRVGELSMWKGASFANAGRNGVFSSLLAAEGMTGPAPVFEGEMGFFRQVSGRFTLDLGGFGGKGRPFMINKTYVKYWPAEYHAQTAVTAAAEIHALLKGARGIRSVLVETHEAGYTILGRDRAKWAPKTKETADHSLPYMTAAALLYGKVDNESYTDKRLKDPAVLALMKKTEVKEDPALTRLYPKRGMANRVTVVAVGRRITREVVVPRGHPSNPMTEEEMESKFNALAGRRLGARGAKEAIRIVRRLERVDDLSELTSSLVVAS